MTPIGQTLKAAREQRGLSLLDASHATRIPVARLHLLEQDNYAAFGSMTYARAFLRRYSQFLGVDASAILDGLPGGVLGGPRDYRYLLENHGDWVAPRGSLGRLSSPQIKGSPRRSPVPAGIVVFVLALVGTGIWGKYVAEDRLAQQQTEVKTESAIPAAPLSASVKTTPKAPAAPVKILRALPVKAADLTTAGSGQGASVQ